MMACRSEEHTSELQSLMRISDAGFCLKKKKKNINKCQNCHLTIKTRRLSSILTTARTYIIEYLRIPQSRNTIPTEQCNIILYRSTIFARMVTQHTHIQR